ncbi:MAG TPA: pyridoxamine 5'-phosphate oxidase family protein [Paucimonas sp.]|nr:pyridoxamine 5'-phosphate oxidase family protein [Paucimonas sp.]
MSAGSDAGRPAPGPLHQGAFHAGELRAHLLAGGGAPGAAIRDFMPDQHRDFFALLRFMLLGTIDSEGFPAATVVSGPAGFVASPDPRSLRIRAAADDGDPVRRLLHAGSAVGLLGIDFGTRRRNRANGVVAALDADAMSIAVRQSFGNCPKYIRLRELDDAPAEAAAAPASASAVALHGLDAAARAAIAAAETFFVASSSGAEAGAAGGVDVSHRGGAPGFVELDGDTLTIPDYSGNRYFNTLGNLLLEPRAALLFIDFSNGDLLHLQGRTEIRWNADEAAHLPGALRLWRFHVERGWRRRQALPLRWTPV